MISDRTFEDSLTASFGSHLELVTANLDGFVTDKLVTAGVVLSSQGAWDRGTPQFLFTKLNSIKPAMMADATKAAREAANQFAADSRSRVGSIRRATQGLFTISDRDQSAGGDRVGGEGGGAGASDPNKRVRVVVTVDYSLDK